MNVKEYGCRPGGATGYQRHSVTKGGVRVRENIVYVPVSQKINPLPRSDALVAI